MNELNSDEIKRFKGSELETVRCLADSILSPGRGVYRISDDLDFALLLLRQLEGGSDDVCKSATSIFTTNIPQPLGNTALGTFHPSPDEVARVAQQRYSDLAHQLLTLGKKAEEISSKLQAVAAHSASNQRIQLQPAPSAIQDAFRPRSISTYSEVRTSNELSQHPASRNGEHIHNTQTPFPGQLFLSPSNHPSRSRSLERTGTSLYNELTQAGRSTVRQPFTAGLIESAFSNIPTVSRPIGQTGSLERLATQRMARAADNTHSINDTQFPASNSARTTTFSVAAPPSSSTSGPIAFPRLSADSSRTGHAGSLKGPMKAASQSIHFSLADTSSWSGTGPLPEMFTFYLRWTNFDHGKPAFLPFSTLRNASVRIAHSIDDVNIISILDTRARSGDVFLKFSKSIEAKSYAEYVRSYPEVLGPQSSIVSASEQEYMEAEKVASARWPDRRPAMEVFGGVSFSTPAPTLVTTIMPPDTSSESSRSTGGTTLVEWHHTPSKLLSGQHVDKPEKSHTPATVEGKAPAGAKPDEVVPNDTPDDGDGLPVSKRGCRGGVRVRKRRENRRLREELDKHDSDLKLIGLKL